MTHTKITPQIAALYLGTWCEVTKAETYWFEKPTVGDKMLVSGKVISMLTTEKGFEIILRLHSLNSLSDEQAMDCYNIFFEGQTPQMSIGEIYEISSKTLIDSGKNIHLGTAPIQNHLRALGFDLDCLIEAGLAKEIAP